MDERWDKVMNQFYGIVMAYAYPAEFHTPTLKDCRAALDTYDAARKEEQRENQELSDYIMGRSDTLHTTPFNPKDY